MHITHVSNINMHTDLIELWAFAKAQKDSAF